MKNGIDLRPKSGPLTSKVTTVARSTILWITAGLLPSTDIWRLDSQGYSGRPCRRKRGSSSGKGCVCKEICSNSDKMHDEIGIDLYDMAAGLDLGTMVL